MLPNFAWKKNSTEYKVWTILNCQNNKLSSVEARKEKRNQMNTTHRQKKASSKLYKPLRNTES